MFQISHLKGVAKQQEPHTTEGGKNHDFWGICRVALEHILQGALKWSAYELNICYLEQKGW